MRRGGCERRRVVVTGMGCVTPLGGDVAATWSAALAGSSGVVALQDPEFADLPVRIGAPAREPQDDDVPPRERRRLDRVVRLALAAAREAAADAGLAPGVLDGERAGVAIGTGIGGVSTMLEGHRAFLAGGSRRVNPFLIPMSLPNQIGGYVAIRFGLRGPSLCPALACASGSHALGEAARMVARGDADVMFAGGSEAALHPLVLAGFHSMQALSRRRDAPERACRPFDRERDGIVLGEGAAVLVLEARDHARARGARERAELLGYATTSDAAHIAAPDAEGRGAERCMALSLEDAGVALADVGYLNAHATGTPAGDRAEARAIRRLFGAHANHLPVSSTKGTTGHLLGASGAVEAALCVCALETGALPPTLNLDDPDPECDLDHIAHKLRASRARVVLSNSFGFGGTNASLVFGAVTG